MTVGNVPLDISTLVGRNAETAQACSLLSRVRLLTLTGPGGVGKTRLAIRVASRVQQSAPDGVWMVDLGALSHAAGQTPERLYSHVALGLGIRYHGVADLDVLVDHLRTRRVLLLIDNCEHLIAVTRALATALLQAAPHLRVLATSRQALGADGEHTLVVRPLPRSDAVSLFQDRATAVGGAAVAASADKEAIAALCDRLDRLPLAIQLAASRVRTLSVGQLIERLDDRFRLLALHTAEGESDRHSALEHVVDWSYDLCTPAEQLVWARAGVFAQRFDLAAAEAVCSGYGIDPAHVVDLVAGLVEKSVLSVDAAPGGVRYYLLDTLRDYGLRRLAVSGEMDRVRGRHRDYYQDLLDGAAARWLGPRELDAMATVHQELPNVLSAIEESVGRGEMAAARAMCRDLVRVRAPFFWGFLELARGQLRLVIDASGMVSSAEEAADLAVTIATEAWVTAAQGHHEGAKALLAVAYDLHREWGFAVPAPVLFASGGTEALGTGSPGAMDLLSAARGAFDNPHAAGDRHMATMMWAMACAFAADPDTAVQAGDKYLREARDAQSPWAISWALWVSALAALKSGDHHSATAQVHDALRLQRDMDDHWGQTWSVELAAWIIAARLVDTAAGEAERAAWLLGAAESRRQGMGVRLAGMRPLAERHARARAHIANVLDEPRREAAMGAGRRGQAQAIRVALGESSPRRPTASGANRLTDREREVVELVAEGLTSVEIGLNLRISQRTVDVHIRNIMKKLGVHRRAGIVNWVRSEQRRQS